MTPHEKRGHIKALIYAFVYYKNSKYGYENQKEEEQFGDFRNNNDGFPTERSSNVSQTSNSRGLIVN